jgi:hypothetical protein
MKELSASIVVLAGSIPFAVGGLISHDQTQTFVLFSGAIVALIGLWRWWICHSAA